MEKKDLASILIKKTNSYFRKSNDKNSPKYIFDTAINTARKIVLQLGSNVTRRNHVVLCASMQSGKTSVCNSVINIINTSKLYKSMAIKKYMFITGMNDCGLKEQTYIRLKEQVMGASDDNIYIGKRSKKNLSENKYFVLKNSDLLSYEGNIDNTLIFIDESHYGSNEKNILTKFLVKHGIDWKDTNELIKRNIYIVSISATPFDELVSDTVNCKKTIELNTDDNYVGVTEYLKNDLIFDTEKHDITEDGRIFDLIMDAHHRMLDNDEDGAIIIRTRNTETIIENQYVQTHFDVFEMTSSGTKIEYAKFNHMLNAMYENNVSYKRRKEALAKFGVEIESPTTKPLIVIIKGAFRAGITIDSRFKDMIYMVYDSSVKADTTAQALLGRMCGYRSSKDKITNTYFYINKNHANMYSQWEGDFQNKNLIPCDKCVFEWTDNGYKGDDVIFSEVSPRPHDTGMVTMISQDMSEFALHARAILGLPVPEIKFYGPSASKAIVVEGNSTEYEFENLDKVLEEPGVQIRIFGKPEIVGHRRLGVILATDNTVEEALAKAERAYAKLKVTVK